MPVEPTLLRAVAPLGTAQTLAWASSYYLPAMLATPMARDLGVSAPTVFAAFSLALIVSAIIGPWAGRLIDLRGGRTVLMGTNGVFAVGLVALGCAQGPWTLFAAWAVLGLAMGSGLYEAAFATLVRLFGPAARSPITGITLFAGFASTIGWPLSTLMEAQFGWRGACFGWAALHVLIGLPLNAVLPRVARLPDVSTKDLAPAPQDTPVQSLEPSPALQNSAAPEQHTSDIAEAHQTPTQPHAVPEPTTGTPSAAGRTAGPTSATSTKPRPPGLDAAILAFVFAATWFTSTAMAAHLPRLLQACGATLAVAVTAGALIGPAQVAARVLEFSVLRHVHPLLSARLATLAHPLGAGALLLFGAPAAAVFALLHGAGNGILTIAKGTLPLVLFGPQGYGARQGWLMMPARVAQALAPFAFGMALDAWGPGALWLSGGLGLAAFAALMGLRGRAGNAQGQD